MNNQMAINTYLSTVESKKQIKQTRRTEQNHGYGQSFDGWGERCGRMGEEARGLRHTSK